MSKPTSSSTIVNAYLTSQQSLMKIITINSGKTAFKSNIQSLLKSFNDIIKVNPKLLLRHIQSFYQLNHSILANIFLLNSAFEVWQLMTKVVPQTTLKIQPILDNQTEANQECQNIFLNYLFVILNKIKLKYTDILQMNSVEDISQAIQILRSFIFQRKIINNQIKYNILKNNHKNTFQKKIQAFHNYSKSAIERFQIKKQMRITNFYEKIDIKTKKNKQSFDQRFFQNNINASPQLMLTKNIALQSKLSPYKWQSKRKYSQNVYKHNLFELQNKHLLKNKKKLNQYQKSKINKSIKQQKKKIQALNYSLQAQKKILELQLNQQKVILQKKQKITAMKNIHKQISKDNKRILSLKKKLNTFEMHQQSKKIKEIIKNHKYKVQFCNDISMVKQCNEIIKRLPQRYNIHKFNEKDQVFQQSLRNYPHSLLRNTIDIADNKQSLLKKSLTDLYDEKLHLTLI